MQHLLSSAFLSTLASCAALQAALPQLKVSDDHRHIITADGKPFFYLADTAWELFHRLTREEADRYLSTRAKQGFNVINAVALAEHDLSTPNAYGELALENFDPAKPREVYFKHVDSIVNKAESLGIYTAFVPTWGDKWNKRHGKGPEIFTPENARIYGEWLGRRYRDKAVIWILGGDRPVETDTHRAIIRAMAAGLKAGDGGTHLISFHPNGTHNSAEFWPDEPWLDFHQFQSGHHKQAVHNFDYNAKNLVLVPLKPTLDGEPCYEDHPVRGLAKKDVTPTVWFDEYDARRAAWWSVLSGACGHVYGDHSVWQFYDGKRAPVFFARTPWPKAIEYPGAKQMGYMRKILESVEWWKLRRDDAFMNSSDSSPDKAMCAVADDGSFALMYGPVETSFAPKLEKMSFKFDESEAVAFDPATGDQIMVHCLVAGVPLYVGNMHTTITDGTTTTVLPKKKDWVLLLRKKKG